MKQPSAAVNYDRVAHLQTIPDYKAGMVLPDEITALYNRLSRDDKDKEKKDDSNSIANPKKIQARYAAEQQLPNPVFFTDDGISGTTFDRPDFQAAIALVEAGRVKNFVVKDMSRFGRDYIQVGLYTEVMFSELNVRFIASLIFSSSNSVPRISASTCRATKEAMRSPWDWPFGMSLILGMMLNGESVSVTSNRFLISRRQRSMSLSSARYRLKYSCAVIQYTAPCNFPQDVLYCGCHRSRERALWPGTAGVLCFLGCRKRRDRARVLP